MKVQKDTGNGNNVTVFKTLKLLITSFQVLTDDDELMSLMFCPLTWEISFPDVPAAPGWGSN